MNSFGPKNPTAAAPTGCGSTVIPPTTAPTAPKSEPKKELGPEPKKIPTKIGVAPTAKPVLASAYNPVQF